MRFVAIRRRLGTQHHPYAGNRIASYNYGYPPFAYHMKWEGPVNMGQERKERGIVVHDDMVKFENDILGQASELYSQYTQDAYDECVRVLQGLKVGHSQVHSEWVNQDQQQQQRQYTRRFHPLFAQKNVRALLYVLQGVESNIDLASAKIYEYRQTQHQFSQLDFKMPGRHLMSDKQFEEYVTEYANKIIDLAEMPPIYIPRPKMDNELEQNEAEALLYEKVDGANLKMTDISSRYAHEQRPIIVREGITGRLRHAEQDERKNALDLYYPSKVRLQQCPLYIDVDRFESLEAMDNLFKLHGWPAPLQIMDAAVNYYELDDERYLRLRMRVNDRLIKEQRTDDLYASRHYGQLVLYMLENDVTPLALVTNIMANRKGHVQTYELRALLMLLEIMDGEKIDEEVLYTRLFDEDRFTSDQLSNLYPNGKIPGQVGRALRLK